MDIDVAQRFRLHPQRQDRRYAGQAGEEAHPACMNRGDAIALAIADAAKDAVQRPAAIKWSLMLQAVSCRATALRALPNLHTYLSATSDSIYSASGYCWQGSAGQQGAQVKLVLAHREDDRMGCRADRSCALAPLHVMHRTTSSGNPATH